MKVSIVIPTYNERENIGKLISTLKSILENLNYEIIVVDDNSPDKTYEVVENLAKKDKNIKLIRRIGKKGLASAVVDGFKKAEGNILVVMDADFQHPPELIPKMVEEIKNGYDIVIGSRYVKGGKIEDWSFLRKIISLGAIFLARILFPKIKVKDCVSGFFALKREVIEEKELNPLGFKILLEILVKGNYKTVKEIPFTFKGRIKGKSNLSKKIIFEYVVHIVKLMRESKEFLRMLKFGFVGFLGIFVNIGVLYILTEIFGIYYLISGIIAVELSILHNFLWNYFWTFKDRNNKFLNSLCKYNLSCLISMVINILVLYTLTQYFGIYYIISDLIGIICGFLANYLLSNHWAFKE
ncbi:MAG: glycosyltransferase family 2 protein [Methanococci archaeon]|nr:glycosyltransferase family 2 protein [Methanococci archaeon]